MLDETDDTSPGHRLPPRWRQPPRTELATGHHLRPVTGSDVDRHLRAVLESRNRLWSIYGRTHGWPPLGLTVEQDRADLARRAAEAEARRSFSYGLFDIGETELLGCVDIDPGGSRWTDPTVSWWVVDWLVGSPVERALEAHVPAWVAEHWPSAGQPARDRNCVSDVRAGVCDLLRRTVRWRVGVGWYLLAGLAVPVGALLLAPWLLGRAPLERSGSNLPLLFTAFLPQLLWAVVTVQFFEELGWAGFLQHRLQARHGALKAAVIVGFAFAFLHLPTYLSIPVSVPSVTRDLSVLEVVVPFALLFRILIAYTYNRTAYAVLIAAVTHASFNEASEIVSPSVPGAGGQVLAFVSTALLALVAVGVARGGLAQPRHGGRRAA